MEEQVFFSDDKVSVSNSRFIVNGQTYVMNSVTSVKSKIQTPQRGAEILIGLFGVAIMFIGSWWTVAGLVILAYAAKIWRENKTTYSVILSTAAGQNKALVSTEPNYIDTIVRSLNDAIVSRG
ncbi:QacE [Aeromonas allosaccharophila]|uniref:DUF6232 family protein n=1 Tax=Aeromonas TaxID=642 RepID=UPI0009697996|nr:MULTISPECIES: DUF6232 family protein [Aeromonas]OKP43517.1 QacE [Aeromonas allosaccharophila]UUI61722.1 DUF6232 family protein [Aeromonas salmonicida]